MSKFRKKPVVIDAYQLPAAGEDLPASFELWCDEVGFVDFTSDRDEGLIIQTLEGDMRANPGDWIIKGVKGEFYPCKPEIFNATYDEVVAKPDRIRRTLTEADADADIAGTPRPDNPTA